MLVVGGRSVVACDTAPVDLHQGHTRSVFLAAEFLALRRVTSHDRSRMCPVAQVIVLSCPWLIFEVTECVSKPQWPIEIGRLVPFGDSSDATGCVLRLCSFPGSFHPVFNHGPLKRDPMQ